MFADDTKLFSTCPSNMQCSIDSMTNWLSNYKFNLAFHKCFILKINKPNISNHSTFTLANNTLQSKSTIKDLGIYISHDLKWATHINYIYNNASQISYQIVKTFKSKNIWTYKKLLLTYIRPKVEYNTPIWSPYLLKDILRIERVQRRYTKQIFRRCGIPFVSYDDRLEKLGIKSLQYRRIEFDIIMLYKIMHGLSFLNFDDFFTFRTTSYDLRGNARKIDTAKNFNSCQWMSTFFVRVTKFWNFLPNEIACLPSLNLFRSKLKRFDLSPLCTDF